MTRQSTIYRVAFAETLKGNSLIISAFIKWNEVGGACYICDQNIPIDRPKPAYPVELIGRTVYYALMGGYFPCSVRLSVHDPPANTTHARKGSTLRLTF